MAAPGRLEKKATHSKLAWATEKKKRKRKEIKGNIDRQADRQTDRQTDMRY